MIKPSHFETPRSMSEAIWLYNCDPIERHIGTPASHVHLAVGALIGITLLSAAISIYLL
jgi:hypothetical protein